MSVDKLVDSAQLDADLTTVANAIRAKGGTSEQLSFPSGMAQAIADIPSGGGDNPLVVDTTTQTPTAEQVGMFAVDVNTNELYRVMKQESNSWVLSSSNKYSEASIAYGAGRFVRVGYDGTSLYSTDGVTWVAMTGTTATYDILSVVYGADRFVCVGRNCSYYSTDGVSWVAMEGLDTTSRYSYYYNVTYGNGRFVCVGTEGRSYYSTNGTSWVAMSGLNSSYNYYRVAYGDDRFVCVSNIPYAGSYYSTDGVTWVSLTGLAENKGYSALAYGNGVFVCIGSNNGTCYRLKKGAT